MVYKQCKITIKLYIPNSKLPPSQSYDRKKFLTPVFFSPWFAFQLEIPSFFRNRSSPSVNPHITSWLKVSWRKKCGVCIQTPGTSILVHCSPYLTEGYSFSDNKKEQQYFCASSEFRNHQAVCKWCFIGGELCIPTYFHMATFSFPVAVLI